MDMSKEFWVPRIGETFYNEVKQGYRCFDHEGLTVGSEPNTNNQRSIKLYIEHCNDYGEAEGIECAEPDALRDFWADYKVIFLSAFKQVDMTDHEQTI